MKTTRLHILFALSLLTNSCFEINQGGQAQLSNQESVTTVESQAASDGSVTANIKANSEETQILNVSSKKLSRIQLALPSGSLRESTRIRVEESASLANALSISGLGTGGVSEVGLAVLVIPEKKVDPKRPLTMSLPIASTSLALADEFENLAVAFKHVRYDDNESIAIGIIPLTELKISDERVVFQTPYFGSFQIVRTKRKIDQKLTAKTTEAPISKVEETKQKQIEKTASAADKTPPLAASNLRFFDSSSNQILGTTSGTFTLVWAQATDPESAILTERILWYNSAACSGNETESSPDAPGILAKTVSAEGLYSFKVKSTNGQGMTSISSCSEAFAFDTSAPSAPTGLITVQNPSIISDSRYATQTNIAFTWSAATETQSHILYYRVYIFDNAICSGSAITSPMVTALLQPFTGNNLTTYSFQVSATNLSGLTTTSTCSGSIAIDTSAGIAATNVNGGSGYQTGSNLHLTWTQASHPTVPISSAAVQVFQNGNCTGTADDTDAISTGSVSYDYAIGIDGPYSIKITHSFANGLTTDSACLGPLVFDSSAPSVPATIEFRDNTSGAPTIAMDDDADLLVSWSTASDSHSGISHYDLAAFLNSSCTTSSASASNISTTSTTINLGGTNSTFWFQVKSYNRSGLSSAWSTCTGPVAILPTGMTISIAAGSPAYSSNTINGFSAALVPGASGIEVHRSTTSGSGFSLIGSTTTAAPQLVDNSVNASTLYYYKARGVLGSEYGAWSNEVSITTAPLPPATPGNLKAENSTAGSVALSWDSVADATSYHLYWSTNPAESAWTQSIAVGASTTYLHTSLIAANAYYYRIAAQNVGGMSPLSTPVIEIKTTTSLAMTQKIQSESARRRIVKDTRYNRWWAFACDPSTLQINFRYSNDLGQTWADGGTPVAVTGCNFDVRGADSGSLFYMFLAYENGASISLKRAQTPSGTTTMNTWSSTLTVLTGTALSVQYSNPQIHISNAGFLYLAATKTSYATMPHISYTVFTKTTQAAVSMNTAPPAPTHVGELSLAVQDRVMIGKPGSEEAYLVINHAGALLAYLYNGSSWSAIQPTSTDLGDKAWISKVSSLGFNKAPQIIQRFNNRWFVAGDFNDTSGHGLNDYLSFLEGFAWRPVGAGVNAPVKVMHVTPEALYVGGSFTTAGGLPSKRIARFNGDRWESLGGGLHSSSGDSYVSAIATAGQQVFAAGLFDIGTNADGSMVSGLQNFAKYNLNTGTWSAIGLPLAANETIDAMSLNGAGDKIVVGGSWMSDLSAVSGTARLAAFHISSQTWSSIGFQTSNVKELQSSGSTDFYVASAFAPYLNFSNGTTISQVSAATTALTSISIDAGTLYGSTATDVWTCPVASCSALTPVNATGAPVSPTIYAVRKTSQGLLISLDSGVGKIFSHSGTNWVAVSSDRILGSIAAVGTFNSNLSYALGTPSAVLGATSIIREIQPDPTFFSKTIGTMTAGSVRGLFTRNISAVPYLHTFGAPLSGFKGMNYFNNTTFVHVHNTPATNSTEMIRSILQTTGDNLIFAGSFDSDRYGLAAGKGNILSISSDGTPSLVGDGLPSFPVEVMTGTFDGSQIYAFSSTSAPLKRFTSGVWSDIPNISFSGGTLPVNDMYLDGSDLYLGGRFDNINSSPSLAYFSKLSNPQATPTITGFAGNFAQYSSANQLSVRKIWPYQSKIAVAGEFWKADDSGRVFNNIALFDPNNLTWSPMHEGLPPSADTHRIDMKVVNGDLAVGGTSGFLKTFAPAIASGVARFSATVSEDGDLHVAYENYTGEVLYRSYDATTAGWKSAETIAPIGGNGSLALSTSGVGGSEEVGLVINQGGTFKLWSLAYSRPKELAITPVPKLGLTRGLSCITEDSAIRCLTERSPDQGATWNVEYFEFSTTLL